MKEYRVTVLVLCAIIAVGALFFVRPGDNQFIKSDYNPDDWLTTSYTIFSTELSNSNYEDKYNYNWQPLSNGIQLKPIAWYRHSYVIVDLPDGRRGIVSPSTLSGAVKNMIFNEPISLGIDISATKAKRHGKVKSLIPDSLYSFVGFMGVNEFSKLDKDMEYREFADFPGVVLKHNNSYSVYPADYLKPAFASNLPYYHDYYSDEFKEYVSTKELSELTKEEVDAKYGEPVSIDILDNGCKKAFYRHFRLKESYNYKGVYINYNNDGTTVVEDPRIIENENSLYHIDNDLRPLLSRISSIDWVDLPLAYPLIKIFHLNFKDITNETDNESAYIWIFIVTLIMSILFLVMLGYLWIVLLFPIKSLSNKYIHYIVIVLSVLPTIAIGTLYLELFQCIWIIVAFVTLIMLYIPIEIVSDKLEFNRCDHCRETGCVSHTKNLIDTQVSTRVDTYDYKDTDYEYYWDGDKKTKTVIHKKDHELVETTNKKYRYDFHCSNCNRDWTTIKTESSDRTLGKKTTSHGGTKTTYTRIKKY